jgi:hypothetical protein
MDALELLSDLRNRGIQVYREGEELIVRPRSLLSDQDREAIRQSKSELLSLLSSLVVPTSPVVVEFVYVEPQPKVTPISPKFPPCRRCGARRFWIADSGKVVCGGRNCGEVCYILASIEYHPIA